MVPYTLYTRIAGINLQAASTLREDACHEALMRMRTHIWCAWRSRLASKKIVEQVEMKGRGMVNQQKRVQKETAYSAVLENDHIMVSPSLYRF